MHTNIHTHIHKYINIHTYIDTYTQIHIIHTYTHIYIYTHTNIHTYTHNTPIVTGHGNIKSYFHRFKIIDTPNCPCGNGNQTTENILLECAILQEDRESLIAEVPRTDD